MSSSRSIIDALNPDEASNWIKVGKTLKALEDLSSVTPDGRSWQVVLRERLSELGQELSVGHLNKIRRAYAFLMQAMGLLELSADHLENAPISALEVAEKLFHLDKDLGLQAAADILNKTSPATYIDVNERYTKYLSDHPEKMSPRQAAWRIRKSSKSTVEKPLGEPEKQRPTSSIVETPVSRIPTFDVLAKQMSEYVLSLETELKKQKMLTSSLQADLAETKASLEKVEQELVYAEDAMADLKLENLKLLHCR